MKKIIYLLLSVVFVLSMFTSSFAIEVWYESEPAEGYRIEADDLTNEANAGSYEIRITSEWTNTYLCDSMGRRELVHRSKPTLKEYYVLVYPNKSFSVLNSQCIDETSTSFNYLVQVRNDYFGVIYNEKIYGPFEAKYDPPK